MIDGMRRTIATLVLAFGLTGCAPAPGATGSPSDGVDADTASTAPETAPVVGRLATRRGVFDLTVHTVAGGIDGLPADQMRAHATPVHADIDPQLLEAAPSPLEEELPVVLR